MQVKLLIFKIILDINTSKTPIIKILILLLNFLEKCKRTIVASLISVNDSVQIVFDKTKRLTVISSHVRGSLRVHRGYVLA